MSTSEWWHATVWRRGGDPVEVEAEVSAGADTLTRLALLYAATLRAFGLTLGAPSPGRLPTAPRAARARVRRP